MRTASAVVLLLCGCLGPVDGGACSLDADCRDGRRCAGGRCVERSLAAEPDAGGEPTDCASTCRGCCQGETCLTFAAQSESSCGVGGSTCGVCDSDTLCTAGVCRPLRAGASYPAPHGAFPQVGTAGGHVLHHPRLQAISFSNDVAEDVTVLENMIAEIGGTTYWQAVTSEYDVGPATAATPTRLSEAAPAQITAVEIEHWLQWKLDWGQIALMSPAEDPLYVVLYPFTTQITSGGNLSCTGMGAYHDEVTLASGVTVPFAVIPRCVSSANPLDETTAAISHELVEAATDPYYLSSPAYGTVDLDHAAWDRAFGQETETADMCARLYSAYYRPADFDYVVQRSWSNAAARDSKDPCQPAVPGAVYFDSVPVMTDELAHFGGKGVHIALGAERTIAVRLFSEGPRSAWNVTARVWTGNLTFTWDRTSGSNGDVLHLTIRRLSSGQSAFSVYSSAGDDDHEYFGLVGD